MASNLDNSKRIAKNTVFLYFRTIITLAIALYTSRVILRTLGVEDYGIYNVVGGFVGMFSLISGTLIASSQRFITFELGKTKNGHPREVFSSALILHFVIASLIIVIAETVGVWFLNYQMNIPDDRMSVANWLFQFSLITFVFNLISIPYNAAIVAHERMDAFAYISVLEAVLKLVIVYVLVLLPYDKLYVYGLLMLAVAVIIRFIYVIYCSRNFYDTEFCFVKDRKYYKQMLGFSGWNILGSSSWVLSNYGINILLNLFFGVVVNAARGIASQVDAAVNQFVTNFTMAVNPQITKSYASKDYGYMMDLIIKGARYSYFLLFIMALPLISETEYITKLWLGTIPEYAVVFIRLSLVYMLCQSLSNTLYTAMLATGDIRNYQIVVGGLSLLSFPLTYMFFKMGLPPEYGYLSTIIISVMCLGARLYMLRGMIDLPVMRFVKEVLGRVICVSVIAGMIPYSITAFYASSLSRCFSNIAISVFVLLVLIYYIGIPISERMTIKNVIEQKLHVK